MKHSTRRKFLQASAMLMATAMGAASFDLRKKKSLLSFSTLGCPDWTFEQIADFASRHGYRGLEIRGLKRQMDLVKCPEFSSENRKETLKLMKAKGLHFVNLGSSANLHLVDPIERKKNLDEGRRFIDLAQQLHCPYVRVFPNNLPKDRDKNETMGLITKGLLELGDYAKERGVVVLMETHGDLVKTADLASIMQSAAHPSVGLVWDITNMWTITKESPTEMYSQLKKYIHHTHIKDAKLVEGKPQYTLLGRGEVPIFEAIDILVKNDYKGYYSFEWEKLWHPEIAEPEIALADYVRSMKKHIG